MDTFTVIYEFSPYRFYGWPLVLVATGFLVAAWHGITAHRAWGSVIFGAVFVVPFFAWSGYDVVRWHMITVDHVSKRQLSIVEGEVTEVRTTGNSGDQAFLVGGVPFGGSGVLKPGFEANSTWGPELRNGLYARVHYFDMPRVEFQTRALRIITKFELRVRRRR